MPTLAESEGQGSEGEGAGNCDNDWVAGNWGNGSCTNGDVGNWGKDCPRDGNWAKDCPEAGELEANAAAAEAKNICIRAGIVKGTVLKGIVSRLLASLLVEDKEECWRLIGQRGKDPGAGAGVAGVSQAGVELSEGVELA